MKIGIRADGGYKEGMGHIVRCMALYLELEEKRNVEVMFLSRHENNLDKYFEERKINYIPIKSNEIFEEKAEMKRVVDSYGIDIIITDSYMLNEDYLKFLKSICKMLISIDDNYLYDYPSHLVINPNIYAEKSSYKGRKTTNYLIGGEYCILRKEFREECTKKISVDVNNILITMGGTDVNNVTTFIINSIKELKDFTINVVISNGYRNIKAIENIANKSKSINLIYNPKNMKTVMERCDICISSSGTTTYELASVGVPTLLIIQAQNQLRIAKFMEDYGAMINLGWYCELKKENLIKNIITITKDYELRLNLSEKLKQLININGVKNVVDEIVNMAKSLVT